MNKKQKDKFINLILILIAIILIITNLIIFLKMKEIEKNNNTISEEINSDSEEDYNDNSYEKVSVKDMDEQERMMYYINEFLDKLEEKDYKKAYELLNEDFKQNYFDTEEQFKNYIESNYNFSTIAIDFKNIERLGNPTTGNIYVVFVNMVDYVRNQSEDEVETKFVILENDYDDFELSFSLK